MQTFWFMGQERWQAFFASPNHLACVLGTLLGASLSVQLRFANKFHDLVIKIFSVLTIIILTYSLCHTYSRGGIFSYSLALIILIIFFRKIQALSIGYLVTLLIIAYLIPHEGSRILSATQLETDPSIANRLKVWIGALEIATDHPITGIGNGRFGGEFMRWYQPLNMHTEYDTAVSDVLTIAAEEGLIILSIFVFIIYFPLIALTRPSIISKLNGASIGIAAALFILFINSFFTSFERYSWIFISYFLLYFLITYILIYTWQSWKNEFRKILLISFIMTSFSIMVIILLSWTVGRPPTTTAVSRTTYNHYDIYYINDNITINVNSSFVIVYIGSKNEDHISVAKYLLRPLARNNLVISVESDENSLELSRLAALKYPGYPIILIGRNGCAENIIRENYKAGTVLCNAIVGIDAQMDSPLKINSISRLLPHSNVATLLLFGMDELEYQEAAIRKIESLGIQSVKIKDASSGSPFEELSEESTLILDYLEEIKNNKK